MHLRKQVRTDTAPALADALRPYYRGSGPCDLPLRRQIRSATTAAAPKACITRCDVCRLSL